MVGGQVADLDAEHWRGRLARRRAARLLEYIHLHKTAALIIASLEAGAILAGASAGERRHLRAYGAAIGLSFQVADDILDVVGDKKKLGKRGSDAANQKLTYVSLYGLERPRRSRGSHPGGAPTAAALRPPGPGAARPGRLYHREG